MNKKINNIVVVIPVFNEEKYLSGFIDLLLKEVKKIRVIKEIIFVDDGSYDTTPKLLKKYQKENSIITVTAHKKNRGKGAALRTGFDLAKKAKPDGVIFIDGDQQHDPKYLISFIESLSQFPIVFGFRNLTTDSPVIRKWGNQIAKFIIRKLFHIERKDLLCGFMAIRSDLFNVLFWRSDDYGVETEISTLVEKLGLEFKEINIKNIYLDKRKGVNLFDAFLILLKIPFWYFSKYQLYFFSIISVLLLIYSLLAFKNPFSTKSLIPNLEPYPDTLYYATPAWNFIKGRGFNMIIGQYKTPLITPPLYSVYLIPFFALFSDVRSFYFGNMILMISSIILFILILKKIFKEGSFGLMMIFFLTFLLVTNFYFYTLPSFLMAENITIFILLFAIYLLLANISRVTVILAGFLGMIFWLIKFSNLPLGLVFYFFYSLKIVKNKTATNFKFSYFLFLLISAITFIFYLYHSQVLVEHKNLQSGTSFSAVYFLKNLTFYLNSLTGGETKYLWFQEKMFGSLIGFVSLLSLFAGLLRPKFRRLGLVLLGFIFSLIAFMSFFYAEDARFIIVLLPLIIIGLSFVLDYFYRLTNIKIALTCLLLITLGYFFMPGFGQKNKEAALITFKKQIGLNFKHRETPWNYLAVESFNQFFEKKENRNSYLGTFLPPFFIKFYSNSYYQLLPLTLNQDFYYGKGSLGEQMKIVDISSYYTNLLKNNKKVFVSNFYVNNLSQWRIDLDNLLSKFKAVLVKKGCLGSCNIYSLTLK